MTAFEEITGMKESNLCNTLVAIGEVFDGYGVEDHNFELLKGLEEAFDKTVEHAKAVDARISPALVVDANKVTHLVDNLGKRYSDKLTPASIEKIIDNLGEKWGDDGTYEQIDEAIIECAEEILA